MVKCNGTEICKWLKHLRMWKTAIVLYFLSNMQKSIEYLFVLFIWSVWAVLRHFVCTKTMYHWYIFKCKMQWSRDPVLIILAHVAHVFWVYWTLVCQIRSLSAVLLFAFPAWTYAPLQKCSLFYSTVLAYTAWLHSMKFWSILKYCMLDLKHSF